MKDLKWILIAGGAVVAVIGGWCFLAGPCRKKNTKENNIDVLPFQLDPERGQKMVNNMADFDYRRLHQKELEIRARGLGY